jgi:hypothetical protein
MGATMPAFRSKGRKVRTTTLIADDPALKRVAAQVESQVTQLVRDNADRLSPERSHAIAAEEFFKLLELDPEGTAAAIIEIALDGYLPAIQALDEFTDRAVTGKRADSLPEGMMFFRNSPRRLPRSAYAPQNRAISNGARDVFFTYLVLSVQRDLRAAGWRKVPLSKSPDGESSIVSMVAKAFKVEGEKRSKKGAHLREAQGRAIFRRHETSMRLLMELRVRYPDAPREDLKAAYVQGCIEFHRNIAPARIPDFYSTVSIGGTSQKIFLT